MAQDLVIQEPLNPDNSDTLQEQIKSLKISSEIERMTAAEADAKLVLVTQALDVGRLKQAELLVHMSRNKLYTELGHDSFEDYCDHLNMARRTGFERMQVFNYMEKLNVPLGTVEKIGWSKVATIVGVSDDQNRDYWLEKADTLGIRMLREEIKNARTSSGAEGATKERKPLHLFQARLTDDQLENVDAAIQNAGTTVSKEGNRIGYLLDLICLEYNANATFSAQGTSMTIPAQLEWLMQRMEATFGVELQIVKEEE